MSTLARITQELQQLEQNPNPNYSAGPINESDMFKWHGTITGEQGTPYQGGKFFLTIEFKPDHPFKPPKVTFVTRIYHPNINSNGSISLAILRQQWSPSIMITDILQAILSLVKTPDLSEILAPDIAIVYQTDKSQFEATAQQWTNQWAI